MQQDNYRVQSLFLRETNIFSFFYRATVYTFIIYLTYTTFSVFYLYLSKQKINNFFTIPLSLIFSFALYFILKYGGKAAFYTIQIFAFCLSIIWGIQFKVTHRGDPLFFYLNDIHKLLEGDVINVLLTSKSPLYVLYNTLIIQLPFSESISFFIGGSIISTLLSLCVTLTAKEFKLSTTNSYFCGCVSLFFPSLFFLSCVLTPSKLFILLILYSYYLTIKAIQDKRLIKFAYIGIVLGLAQFTRSNAILFLIGHVFSLFLILHKDGKKTLIANSIVILSFILILSPHIFTTYIRESRIDLKLHRHSGILLLIGTDQRNGGFFNYEVIHEAKEKLNLSTIDNQDLQKTATHVAIKRIFSPSFIKFAFGKIRDLWSVDTAGVHMALGYEEDRKILTKFQQKLVPIFEDISNYSLIILMALSFLSYLRSQIYNKKSDSDNILIATSGLLLQSILLIFIEIGPRYHLIYIPFFLLITIKQLQLICSDRK